MKKVIIVLTLILTSAIAINAQSDTLKPMKGDWGFSINITGLINNIVVENGKDPNGHYTIFARHYIKNDQALRLGLGLNYDKQGWFNSDSINLASGNRALQEVDSSQSQFDFSISVGIEKHLGKTRRLDPYVGGDIIIVKKGATKINASTDITDVTGTQSIQRILQEDGGFGFGLGGVAGFNYFISKNFSLGAEFGYSYIYNKSGGDFSESLVDTPVSGSQISTFISGKSESSQTSIGTSTTGAIMLSFFF